MPIIFITFLSYYRNNKSKEYYINDIEQKLFTEIKSRYDTFHLEQDLELGPSLHILRIEEIDDLKIYQKVFNFEGNYFSTLINSDVLQLIKTELSINRILELLSQIFKIYEKSDNQFHYYFKKFYQRFEDTNIDILSFEDFLIDWRNYLYYQKCPNILLDKNLNNLIGEYLNPNPYIKINNFVYFLVNKYNCAILRTPAYHRDRECLKDFANFIDPQSIKLLKFIDKYNVDELYYFVI
jgi:hypothetical protein